MKQFRKDFFMKKYMRQCIILVLLYLTVLIPWTLLFNQDTIYIQLIALIVLLILFATDKKKQAFISNPEIYYAVSIFRGLGKIMIVLSYGYLLQKENLLSTGILGVFYLVTGIISVLTCRKFLSKEDIWEEQKELFSFLNQIDAIQFVSWAVIIFILNKRVTHPDLFPLMQILIMIPAIFELLKTVILVYIKKKYFE